jgi:hypothetical protein
MSTLTKNMLLASSILLLLAGCDKPEIVPAYVYVKPFQLTTDASTEGVNSSKITETWVYFADGTALGGYKVPGEVPIPANGKTALIFYAGIRNNGFSGTPTIYYHYQRYDVTLDLKAGQTDTITPQISYIKNLNFAWLEDFETKNTLNVTLDTLSAQNFEITNTDVRYGSKCGLMQVSDKANLMAITTKEAITNLPSNQRVYLELDYKGSAVLKVKLIGNRSIGGPVELESADFKPQADWNKTYINYKFKDYSSTEYPSFNFVFAAGLPSDANGNPTINEAEMRIDNIKLIYPK